MQFYVSIINFYNSCSFISIDSKLFIWLLDATNTYGKLLYWVEFADGKRCFIPAVRANDEFPELVAGYLESKMIFGV